MSSLEMVTSSVTEALSSDVDTTPGSFENISTTSMSEEERQFVLTTNTVLATVVSVSCGLGLLGNSLVVIAWSMSRKLQTITNIFVISLSFTDFLGCAMLPIQVIAYLDFDNGRPVPVWVCQMCGALCLVAFKSSVVHLALIGINRVVCITQFRARYLQIYSTRNVVLMVLFAWIFPILLIVLPPAVGLGRLGYNAVNQLCVLDGTPEQLRIIYICEEILFSLSFIMIIGCYLRIYVYINRQHRDLISIYSKREHSQAKLEVPRHFVDDSLSTEIEVSTTESPSPARDTNDSRYSRRPQKDSVYTISPKASRDRKRTKSSEAMRTVLTKREIDITKNLFVVVCCFFVFVFPHILCLLSAKCYTFYFKYTATILVINSCTNPFIYCLKHPTFKEVSACLLRGNLARIPYPANWLKHLLSR